MTAADRDDAPGARPGVFVPVVGPSGVGKDTLINAVRAALADDRRIVFTRRVVTRAAGGNEDHDSIDPAAFADAVAAGRYALHWQAHGLGYGIPAETVAQVAAGRVVVANLSRGAIPAARTVYPAVAVVRITAPAAVLAERLSARGRESEADIRERLERAAAFGAVGGHAIDNGGALEAAVAAFSALLQRFAAEGAPAVPA